MADKGRQKTRLRGGTPRATAARAGGISLPTGGALAKAGGAVSTVPPASLLGLGADASGQMETIAPTFGNILSSVGLGVANSQAALDKGVVDTVKGLSDTKITVVTEVIEQLDDDGLPDVAATQLVTQDLSVLNFITPTVHEWKHVALSLDMSVGAMDNETGATYHVESHSTSMGSAGLFAGFVGLGYFATNDNYRDAQSNSHREAQWASGTVQLDAVLAPRRTTKFPVPASVSIGPQIFVSQGGVVETKVGGVVTERSLDIVINVRKASGAANPDKTLDFDAGGLLPSFSSVAPFNGSITNADGQCKVTLKRNIVMGFAQPSRRTLTVRLGQISKRVDIVI